MDTCEVEELVRNFERNLGGLAHDPQKIGCATPWMSAQCLKGVVQPKNCWDWGLRNKFEKNLIIFHKLFGGHNER